MKEITEEQNVEIGNVITKAEAFVKENQKKIILLPRRAALTSWVTISML